METEADLDSQFLKIGDSLLNQGDRLLGVLVHPQQVGPGVLDGRLSRSLGGAELRSPSLVEGLKLLQLEIIVEAPGDGLNHLADGSTGPDIEVLADEVPVEPKPGPGQVVTHVSVYCKKRTRNSLYNSFFCNPRGGTKLATDEYLMGSINY